MDTFDNNIADKRKMHKSEITKRLYYLNSYIYQLKTKRNECSDEVLRNGITSQLKKFYLLKEHVLVKMIKEGFATIKQMQIGDKVCYCVVRVNRETTFHLPISNELSKLMRKVNENKENGAKFCSEEQRF